MMPGAGLYDTKLIWMTVTKTKDPNYGEETETFTANGELWSYVEELSASEMTAWGMKDSKVDVKIHIRNSIDIGFADQLKDKESGEVYYIDGVLGGPDETVVIAHRGREV